MACSRFRGFVGVVIAGSMFISSTGAVAATSAAPIAPQINPWAALTAMSGGAPAAALCGAAAAAAVAQAPATNCVLPAVDAVPVATAPPQPIPVPPVEPAGGFGFNPLLLALGALAAGALIYFLVIKDKDDDDDSPP